MDFQRKATATWHWWKAIRSSWSARPTEEDTWSSTTVTAVLMCHFNFWNSNRDRSLFKRVKPPGFFCFLEASYSFATDRHEIGDARKTQNPHSNNNLFYFIFYSFCVFMMFSFLCKKKSYDPCSLNNVLHVSLQPTMWYKKFF